MPETESDYPPPPEELLSYGDSWRPEDKAMESAEVEALTQHPKHLTESNDAAIDPAQKDH